MMDWLEELVVDRWVANWSIVDPTQRRTKSNGHPMELAGLRVITWMHRMTRMATGSRSGRMALRVLRFR